PSLNEVLIPPTAVGGSFKSNLFIEQINSEGLEQSAHCRGWDLGVSLVLLFVSFVPFCGKYSTGIPQAGGDAVDCCRKRVVQVVVVLTASLPSQQLNLNQTQRIDVRIAQANRTRQHRVLLE